MSDSKLRELWSFDDADLGANRMGQLTEKQKKFLAGEYKFQRGVLLGVGALVVALFCCFPLLAFGTRGLLPILLSGNPSDLADMIPMFAIGGFGIIFFGIMAAIIGAIVVFYVLRANKKPDITVRRAEGVVTYTWETKRVRTPNSSVRRYQDIQVLMLSVGSENKFEVKQQLQDAIKEGEKWTVYYTSHPFKFLSAELVSKEK